MSKKQILVIVLFALNITACFSQNGATLTSIASATSSSTATPIPTVQPTLTVMSTMDRSTATPISQQLSTPEQNQTSPSPTVTTMISTLPLTINQQIIDLCRLETTPPPKVQDAIYFFTTCDKGWYRTTDEFKTYEQFAPQGMLSPNLDKRVFSACSSFPDPIYIAQPPQATPTAIPIDGLPPMKLSRGHWLSDNKTLIFSSMWEEDRYLYLLDTDTNRLYPITSRLEGWAVSPLEACVAYVADDEESSERRFYITNIEDPNNFHTLFGSPSDQPSLHEWPESEQIIWSPDGKKLAFTSGYPKFQGVIIWDLITYEVNRYKLTGGSIDLVSWSPDGTKIHLSGFGKKHYTSRWLLDVDTGIYEELISLEGWGSSSFPWLPDGRRLVISDHYEAYILDVIDGSKEPIIFTGSDDFVKIRRLFLGP